MTELFPLVRCCSGEQLGFTELIGDELVLVCSGCGQGAAASRYVDDSTLSALGLKIVGALSVEPKTPKKTGCSKGSCGTGGSSCGSSDGCSTCGGGCH